jgi:hypothetical protein
MIAKALEQLEGAGGDERWRALAEAQRRRRQAQARGANGVAEFEYALAEMDRLIEEGANEARNRAALSKQLVTRARLVDSETRRIKLAQDTLAGDQAMNFIVALSNIVKAHVSDQRTLTKISADIARLLDRH